MRSWKEGHENWVLVVLFSGGGRRMHRCGEGFWAFFVEVKLVECSLIVDLFFFKLCREGGGRSLGSCWFWKEVDGHDEKFGHGGGLARFHIVALVRGISTRERVKDRTISQVEWTPDCAKVLTNTRIIVTLMHSWMHTKKNAALHNYCWSWHCVMHCY